MEFFFFFYLCARICVRRLLVVIFNCYLLYYCNEQPSQSHSKPHRWKSMLIHQGWFTALYTQHLLDSQSFEFEICILQALNMPLIRCTNVYVFQGRLSRHTTSPSEKTRPESWPGDFMGKATPVWQLSSSHRCH